MIFEPVWMSSVAHLEAYRRLFRETPMWRHLLGMYRFPSGFPYVHSGLDFRPFGKVPLIALRSGEVHLGNGRVTFVGRPYRLPLYRVFNIPSDGSFSFRIDELTRVERLDFVAPMSLSTTFPFIRVRTTQSGELADFLLCVGGYAFQMKRIRERSLLLFEALQGMAGGGRAAVV